MKSVRFEMKFFKKIKRTIKMIDDEETEKREIFVN
jgi:hypothetical protein